MNIDEKIADLYRIVSMPMANMSYLFYPRLYKISDIISEQCKFGEVDEDSGLIFKPPAKHLRANSLSHFESYIVDDGNQLTFFVGA